MASSPLPLDPVQECGLVLGVKAFYPRPAKPSFLAVDHVQSPVNRVVGRLQQVKAVTHAHLCHYIHYSKGKHDRIYMAAEHYEASLRSELEAKPSMLEARLRRLVTHVLHALSHMHAMGVVHRNLAPHNIVWDKLHNAWKLADWAMYFVTDAARDVGFPIGTLTYLSPEAICAGPAGTSAKVNHVSSTPKADSWSLGVIMLEALLGRHPLAVSDVSMFVHKDPEDPLQDNANNVNNMLALAGHIHPDAPSQGSPSKGPRPVSPAPLFGDLPTPQAVEMMAPVDAGVLRTRNRDRVNQLLAQQALVHVSSGLKEVIRLCLRVDPSERLDAAQLLGHAYFQPLPARPWHQLPLLRCTQVTDPWDHDACAPPEARSSTGPTHACDVDGDPFAGQRLREIFHFWTLSGGCVEDALPPELRSIPPILCIPLIIRVNGHLVHRHQRGDRWRVYHEGIHSVSLAELRMRMRSSHRSRNTGGDGLRFQFFCEGDPLPSLKVREKDIDYQRHRVAIFRRLLAGLPASRAETLAEAAVDIPPVLRADVWAVLLHVPPEAQVLRAYEDLDKDGEGRADHQIDLDVPRCHQYNEFLASVEGQRQLRRVLRAWVAANPSLEYWQGLDSLAATLVTLSFPSEAHVFACLQAVADKFLSGVFLSNNTLRLQCQLVVFRQLLAYQDPQLANHLDDVEFRPELYAIPWFLTLFSHVLPLKDTQRLWDFLLLGHPSLPHFIAVALITELRDHLLPLDFNDLIVFFSHVPRIDVVALIEKSRYIVRRTPLSLTSIAMQQQSTTSTEWWDEPLPLHLLKEYLCPRISHEDLLALGSHAIVLDVRSPEAYSKRRYPASVNLRPSVLKPKEWATVQQQLRDTSKHVVVLAPKGKGKKMANALVRSGVARVSILNGGMEALEMYTSNKLIP